jgi:hypothetical protein
MHESPAQATRTGAIVSAVPADTDAIADSKASDAFAKCIDNTNHFVTRNARQFHAWPQCIDDKVIALANATGLHANADLASTWLGRWAFF